MEQDVKQKRISKHITIVDAGHSQGDNPTYYACERIKEVLEELGLSVTMYSLREADNAQVIQGMAQSAGVVIATTVEWFGVGYQLQKLLDECHDKGKEQFTEIPLLSVVFSRTGYEKEASNYLNQAWQILGGWQGVEICGCYPDTTSLSADFNAIQVIEKKVEQFFRYSLNQGYQLPLSVDRNWENAYPVPSSSAFTKTEIEEDEKTKKERANIEALSNKLKAKLEEKTRAFQQSIAELVQERYRGNSKKEYHVQWRITDKPSQDTVVLIKPTGIYAYLGEDDTVTLTVHCEENVIRNILDGKISFQRAFMTGQLTAKGELNILYQMDELF